MLFGIRFAPKAPALNEAVVGGTEDNVDMNGVVNGATAGRADGADTLVLMAGVTAGADTLLLTNGADKLVVLTNGAGALLVTATGTEIGGAGTASKIGLDSVTTSFFFFFFFFSFFFGSGIVPSGAASILGSLPFPL